MKILMYNRWFYPSQIGGPSNAVYWQAKALTKAGHEITIITTSEGLPQETPSNIWLFTNFGRVIYLSMGRPLTFFKYIFYGYKAVKNTDVVYLNEIFRTGTIIFTVLSRLFGKPIVIAPRGELSEAALAYNKRSKQIVLWLFRKFSSHLVFHSTSADETSLVHQQFGLNAKVNEIENMMEIPEMSTRSPKPYLLFIGRIHPIKAIDKLLEALSLSKIFINSNYSLLIVGPNSDSNYSEQLMRLTYKLKLEDKVSFVGPVNGKAKEQLYSNAYLTILPSNSENFGNVVIESLAQGTPVIASTHTPWQLLKEKQIGSWVSNEPEILKKEIEYYLTMPEEIYIGFRKRGVIIVREYFDIMEKIDKWENFYSIIIETNS